MATGRLPDPNSAPVTAKGDLYTYSTVPAKLAVGNNGETLVADSSATTGLRWTATPSASNPVLNSAMDIWQRGTSISGGGTTIYCADRWTLYRGVAGQTVSRQTTGDTTNLPNIQYCARVQRDSGNTSTNALYFAQSFESVNSIPFAGKTVTLSFYARAGANYSTASSALSVYLYTGTGTDQQVMNGYTGSATPISTSVTLTTTWQRFSATATLASNITEMAPLFLNTPVGTAGAADYYEITGIQIDVGSVALPFRRSSATLAGELAACQRYYWRSATGQSASRFSCNNGSFTTTTNAFVVIQFPTQMRTTASSVDYGGTLALWDFNTDITVTAVALTATAQSPLCALLTVTVASGGTQYRPVQLEAKADSNAYIGFSAEL